MIVRALGERVIRSVSASSTSFPSNSTACTDSVIGISTLNCFASRLTARVVGTPSATLSMCERMSSIASNRRVAVEYCMDSRCRIWYSRFSVTTLPPRS